MRNKPLNRTTLLLLGWLEAVTTVFPLYNLYSQKELIFPRWFSVYECLFIVSLSITTLSSAESTANRFLTVLNNVAYIILCPWLLVGYFSKTRAVAKLTMPMTLILTITPLCTYLTYQLKYLTINSNFNRDTIPYINVTIIIILFSYFQKDLYRYLISITPKTFSNIPIIGSIETFSEDHSFKLVAFWVLAFISVSNTIEKLSGLNLLVSIIPNANIVVESLVTLVVLDRAISVSFHRKSLASNDQV